MLSLLSDVAQVSGLVLALLLLAGCAVIPALQDIELPHQKERKP